MPARAVSARQWRYLNARFGHAWVKAHQISPPGTRGLPALGSEPGRRRRRRRRRQALLNRLGQ
jgi:hypothetical protein